MPGGRHETFQARYGPWAVVAGASEGLGEAYTERIAARGLHLVLIARRAEMLHVLAERLSAAYGIETRVLDVDLAREDVGAQVEEATNGIDVGLVVYNAARSVIGPFLDRPVEDHLDELAVNTRGPMLLTHLFGRRMIANGHGGIILMSSLASLQGSAYTAHYAATKAYNRVLAEGLWEELRRKHVDVLTCLAGATSTPNYVASAPKVRTATMTPEAVAEQALMALGHQPAVIPGISNKAASFIMQRILPRTTAIRIMGRVLRRMYS